MSAVSMTLGRKANYAADKNVGESRQYRRALEAVMRVLRDLYPIKTAANIAARTGVNVRSAERWISLEHDINAEAFVAILTSQDGDKVLQAVMLSLPSKERPRWWLRHVDTARMARIEALQAECDEEIRQLRLDRDTPIRKWEVNARISGASGRACNGLVPVPVGAGQRKVEGVVGARATL